MNIFFRNRFMRYLRHEPQFRLKLLIVVLSIALIFLQKDIMHKNDKKLNEVENQLALTFKIPRMEAEVLKRTRLAEEQRLAKIRAEEEEKARREAQQKMTPSSQPEQTEPDEKPLKLDGIMKEGDKFIALINGAIYEENQFIDEFKVILIKANEVVLMNNNTQAIKRLILPQPELQVP